MDSLILGFNVVFPLLTYMVIGYGIKKIGWISNKTIDEMNKLVFYIFMSVMLFLNAYNVEKEVLLQKENLILVTFALLSFVVIITIANFVCNVAKESKERKAVLIQGVFRSNLALFGLSVNTAIYGEGNSGFLAVMIAVLVPFFNIVSVFLFSNAVASTNENETKVSSKVVFVNVIKNPLVIASVLGIALTLLEVKLPDLVFSTLTNISRVSTPLAFFLLGAGIVFGNMAKNKKAIIATVATKLVIVPLTVISIAVFLGYREQALVAIMCVFASPLAVSAYTMAAEENVEPDLAAELVAVSTVGSVITIFFFIAGLNYFNLM